MVKESGLYMTILSGTLLLLTIISCIMRIVKLHKQGATVVPEETDQVIKIKSSIFYCFGFSITFWLAPLDIILSSFAGMGAGVTSSIVLSYLCPYLGKHLLNILNKRSLSKVV